MSKPRGYIERVLFIDCETSGLAYSSPDPSYDAATGTEYQAVAWGMVVANAQTLKPIEKLYVEIKWDGESGWSKEAQKVHGLSPQYLEKNGVTSEEAVVQIAELIIKHWGTDGVVCVGGHNVATFDLQFLRRLLTKFGLEVKFGSKTIDTNSISFATTQDYNSDDLFESFGLVRDPNNHNALEDALFSLEVVRQTRLVWSKCIGD